MTDLANVNALIVMGNKRDIDPDRYLERYPRDDPRARHPMTRSELANERGKARAIYEEALLRAALKSAIPTLGICGGMQRINVILGGTLHQHIFDLAASEKHAQHTCGIPPTVPVVPILVVNGTLLGEIAKGIAMPFIAPDAHVCEVVVSENSMHHQAVDIVAPGFVASALSDAYPRPDGTVDYMIEAIEPHPSGPYRGHFILGVQWHPEFNASPLGSLIIKRLVDEAKHFMAR